MKFKILSIFLLVFLVSCATGQNNGVADENLTVGTVQKEIKIGMTSVEVVEILGSPNIIQTDENRNEVWVYDKISTQVNRNSSEAGAWFLLLGANSSRSSSSSSQKTLTIIIKFDDNSRVKDFSYHTSRF